MSEARPSDLEALINYERSLAKSEAMKGPNWDKLAMAVVIIMIGGAVALFIINEVLSGGGIFGGGGGGGGGGGPIVATIRGVVSSLI